jgi:glycine cleavage system transcriptional repressor
MTRRKCFDALRRAVASAAAASRVPPGGPRAARAAARTTLERGRVLMNDVNHQHRRRRLPMSVNCAAPASLAPAAVRHWQSTAGAIQSRVIISAYGPDRPGIMSELAKIILESAGNVENSRATRLGDDSNIMMLVCFGESTDEQRRAFERRVHEIPGLTVTLRATTAKRHTDETLDAGAGRWRRIVLHGTDYPGLLHEMAGSLAQEGINIEAINTDTQKAPFGDDDLFTVDAVVEIPADADIARFKKSLDRLKQKLGVDIEVSDHEPYESVQRHK